MPSRVDRLVPLRLLLVPLLGGMLFVPVEFVNLDKARDLK